MAAMPIPLLFGDCFNEDFSPLKTTIVHQLRTLSHARVPVHFSSVTWIICKNINFCWLKYPSKFSVFTETDNLKTFINIVPSSRSKTGCVSTLDPNGCKPCDCDPGGAYDNHCDVITGQCKCRPNVGGRRCDVVNDGFFTGSLDFLLFEGELARGSQNPVR